MNFSTLTKKTFIALLIAGPGLTWAGCPTSQSEQMEIVVQKVEVSGVQQVPMKKLKSIGKSSHPNYASYGLVTSKLRSKVSVSANLRVENRESCLYPKLELTIGFEPMPIYIASELPTNGCAYQAVLQHELKHVEIYKKHLPRIVRLIEAELRPVFSQGYSTDSAKELHKQIATDTKTYVAGAVKHEMSIVATEQEAFDAHDSESTVRGPCASEFKAAYRNS